MPVLRIYRVNLKPGKAGDYERLEREVGIPTVRGMPGCIAAGFGPFKETKDQWAFFSLWNTEEDLQMARGTVSWKNMVQKIEGHGLSVSESAEHILVRSMNGIKVMA